MATNLSVDPCQEREGLRRDHVSEIPRRWQKMLGPAARIFIGSLLIADTPRTSGPNRNHVRNLANALGEFPPIIVHRATMRVIDGIHRLRATELRGHEVIAARMFEGSEAEAFVLAVQANLSGGLPLSVADRKMAAARVITASPQWSDRLIASLTGLSAKTVGEVRRRQPAEQTRRPGSRIGRDGRVRPANSLEKRQLASELILDNPELSLRRVAKAVGISPETARSVRARLRCDTDHGAGESGTPRWTVDHLPEPSPAAVGEADGPRRRQTSPDHATVVRRLVRDPSLRYNENGRTLLRLLEAHVMSGERWTTLANSVPAHRRNAVANVAMEYAKCWQMVAEQLTRNTPSSA